MEPPKIIQTRLGTLYRLWDLNTLPPPFQSTSTSLSIQLHYYRLHGSASIRNTWLRLEDSNTPSSFYFVNVVTREAVWELPDVPIHLRINVTPPFLERLVQCYLPDHTDSRLQFVLCEYYNRESELLKELQKKDAEMGLRMDVVIRIAHHKPQELGFIEDHCSSPNEWSTICATYDPPPALCSLPYSPESIALLRTELQRLFPNRIYYDQHSQDEESEECSGLATIDGLLAEHAGAEIICVRSLWGSHEQDTPPPSPGVLQVEAHHRSIPQDDIDNNDNDEQSLQIALSREMERSTELENSLTLAKNTMQKFSEVLGGSARAQDYLTQYQLQRNHNEIKALQMSLDSVLKENTKLRQEISACRKREASALQQQAHHLQSQRDACTPLLQIIEEKDKRLFELRQLLMGSSRRGAEYFATTTTSPPPPPTAVFHSIPSEDDVLASALRFQSSQERTRSLLKEGVSAAEAVSSALTIEGGGISSLPTSAQQ